MSVVAKIAGEDMLRQRLAAIDEERKAFRNRITGEVEAAISRQCRLPVGDELRTRYADAIEASVARLTDYFEAQTTQKKALIEELLRS